MNNYENLPAVLNANQLAAALGISRAGACHFTICQAQGRRVQGVERPPREDKGGLRQQSGY